MIKFGLIGNGKIAQRHKNAIKHVGGELVWVSDPLLKGQELIDGTIYQGDIPLCDMKGLEGVWGNQIDYVVICSPTYLHRQQTQEALKYNKQVICEKPLCLPWEPLIDDDRINVCLQLRYIENLPKAADLVRAVMVRDEEFFKSWKGDPRQAGGNLYEFFIHYIDLAILLGAGFEGSVLPEGKQVREIIFNKEACQGPSISQNKEFKLDIMAIDMQSLYNRMYEDILNGGGIKPKDIFYLTWVLNQNSIKHGFRKSGIDSPIVLGKELL
jgi:hypothetical protein